jgi:L-ascorbate metabolism protein UlaG (beta-lactamase superfamily)
MQRRRFVSWAPLAANRAAPSVVRARSTDGSLARHIGRVGSTRLTYLGHATVLIETGRLKILTDPILRERVAGVLRSAPIDLRSLEDGLDAVVISHAHYDHLHEGSLRLLDRSTRIIVPRGLGRIVARLGFKDVDEVRVDDTVNIDDVAVKVVHAEHSGQRPPFGPTAPALGYVIEGERRIYFAGDTDVYDGMAMLEAPDAALLPIWGWGPRLGPGHMDPRRAARAAALLRARLAIPIHWGSLYPMGLRRLMPDAPAEQFARAAAELAPATDVRVIAPGGSLDLDG